MKEANYTVQNFNPYDHLKQSVKEDSLPAYKPYIKNGVVQLNAEGRMILVPDVHLDANAYRNWWKKVNPDGRIELIRHTELPILVEETFHYPQEVFEARFYTGEGENTFAGNGFGKAAYKENAEFDEVATAISHAIKNGMRNMGFGVDIDQEVVMERLPKYIAPYSAGRWAGVDVIQESRPAAAPETAPAQAPTPVKEAEETKPQPAQPKADKPVETKGSPAPAAADTHDLLAYMEAKAAAEAETEEPQEDPVVQESEKAEAPAKKKPVKKTAKAPKEEPAKAQIEEPVNAPAADEPAENEAEMPVESSDVEAAKAVVFEVLDPANDKMNIYCGKTIGELAESAVIIFNIVTKPTFRWESRMPKEVYDAICTVKEAL